MDGVAGLCGHVSRGWPFTLGCDGRRGRQAPLVGGRLRPKSRGPFATWGQAEEPGVAFEGCAEDSVVQR